MYSATVFSSHPVSKRPPQRPTRPPNRRTAASLLVLTGESLVVLTGPPSVVLTGTFSAERTHRAHAPRAESSGQNQTGSSQPCARPRKRVVLRRAPLHPNVRARTLEQYDPAVIEAARRTSVRAHPGKRLSAYFWPMRQVPVEIGGTTMLWYPLDLGPY